MSCPNGTSPIDLDVSKITGNCDLKCSYNFNYNNSSCIATNRGDYLSLSYDKSSSPPVTYNSQAYDVQEIRLYTPSLHSYLGTKTEAELIVVHTSNTGSAPLLVCIPVKSNNTSSISSSFFKTLINTVASSAPSDGLSTTVQFTKYNLTVLVPRKPFFSYSATTPYQPCSETVEIIAFDSSSALDMMPDTLTKLQSIIQPNGYDIKTGPSLFYNQNGPNRSNNSDDIYIDCQPVGSSNEEVEIVVNTDSSGSTMTFDDLANNVYVRILLGSLLFVFLLFVIKNGLGFFKPVKDLVGGGYGLVGGEKRVRFK